MQAGCPPLPSRKRDEVMSSALPNPAPPQQVLVEFLRALQCVLSQHEVITPVLRGSLLLRLWFGELARPAADIDLEWFALRTWRADRFESPLAHARTLCLYAACENFSDSSIGFDEDVAVPSGGVSLWEYESPGFRCFTGWEWYERNLRGQLQIDLAVPTVYDLTMISCQELDLSHEQAEVRLLTYTPEMLLAAKLSWIIRHVLCKPTLDNATRLSFFGEPKDVYDAYLLVTQGQLRPTEFHQAVLAVALEDKLNWQQIETFLEQTPEQLSDQGFIYWQSFAEGFAGRTLGSPAEMLATIIQRVKSLWSDNLTHAPFLQAISQNPSDESNYLIYADWLDDRDDPRALVLKLFCQHEFHPGPLDRSVVAAVQDLEMSAWLAHALAGTARARAFLQRVKG